MVSAIWETSHEGVLERLIYVARGKVSGVLALRSCPECYISCNPQVYAICFNWFLLHESGNYKSNTYVVDGTCTCTICIIECICITRPCEVFYWTLSNHVFYYMTIICAKNTKDHDYFKYDICTNHVGNMKLNIIITKHAS